jgi:hypothetical protein
MSGSPNYVQHAFRGRSDTGTVEATPTWIAAEDTSFSRDRDAVFRVRFLIRNTGTASGNVQYRIRARVKPPGGAYGSVFSLTTTSDHIRTSTAASSSADAASITTTRLTSPGGTYITGQYDDNGATANINVTAGNYTEIEYGLELVEADFSTAGDWEVELQVYNNTTALHGYTQTPVITVAGQAPADPPGPITDYALTATGADSYSRSATEPTPAADSYQVQRLTGYSPWQ